jgi:hypothetical protein
MRTNQAQSHLDVALHFWLRRPKNGGFLRVSEPPHRPTVEDGFDTRFYLKAYSDIRDAGLNPFWHYVVAEAMEGRDALSGMSAHYEDQIGFGSVTTDIRLLAFYASPKWAAVRGGRPRFMGHYQPMLPSEKLGAYDPSDWRVLKDQAHMATRHGIYGFCFDLDFVSGTAVELQPTGQLLAHDEIEIRFCTQIAISSECSLDLAADSLVRILADRRQIRVDDRAVLLVKVAEHWEGASACLARLRQLLVQRGVEDPFVIVRWRGPGDEGSALAEACDAVLDLPSVPVFGETDQFYPMEKSGIATVPYSVVASNGVARTTSAQQFVQPVLLYRLARSR